MSPVHITEELPLRDLLEVLLGPEGRRRLTLRHMPNDQLFQQYDSELLLRLRNPKNLSDTRKMLQRFKEYLGGMPPSPETAKAFLSQFAGKKPRTLARYAQMIKALMKWYGEPIDDVRIKVPKSLPAYVEDIQVERLLEAIANKKTHKGTIVAFIGIRRRRDSSADRARTDPGDWREDNWVC